MRKFILSAIIAIFAVAVQAQPSEGRTANTVVADVLAQMPAQDSKQFDRMLGDLVKSGSEGINILINKLSPWDGDKCAPIEYALGGLTAYASDRYREGDRILVAKCYIDALDRLTDREAKAFIIRQIQWVAKDEACDVLKKYALSQDLCEDAVKALVMINRASTKDVLRNIITTLPSKSAAAIAIADMHFTEYEPLLISWYKETTDPKLKRSITTAMGKVGGEASLVALEPDVLKLGYAYNDMLTTDAYLTIINKLPLSSTVANKHAQKVVMAKNATTAARTVAAKRELSRPGSKSEAIIAQALLGDDRVYRVNVLNDLLYSDLSIAEKVIAKNYGKLSDKAKCDVVYFMSKFGNVEYADPRAADDELRKASAHALAKDDSKASLEKLVAVFTTEDEKAINTAKEALKWAGSTNYHLLNIANPSDAGTIAILDVLATRKDPSAINYILYKCPDMNTAISEAAYDALINCSTFKEYAKLFDMLANDNGTNVAKLQEAIGAQLRKEDKSAALDRVKKEAAKSDKLAERTIALMPYIGTKESLNFVESSLGGSDVAKQEAIKALTLWKSNDAIFLLRSIIANPDLKASHPQATETLIKLTMSSAKSDQWKLLVLREALESNDNPEVQNMLLRSIGNLKTFNGLLLAGKYMQNPALAQTAAVAAMNIAIKDKDYSFWGPEVKSIMENFMKVRSGGDAEYEKKAVSKYLDEAPKEGSVYVSLFNGKDLTGWKGLVANPIARSKMTEKKLAEEQVKADEGMRKGWVVKDGLLVFTGHGDNLCTDKNYGNFEMYVDWQITKDGDAGIYLRGTPQVQIWDTCRHDVGAQVGSGGLYNNGVNPSKPLVLADNRIGDWNTFYIKMVGERVTVYLNGELVVDNVILENYWNRSLPIFLEEQIELQAHGTYVAYRDVYIKELPKTEVTELCDQEKKDGFVQLFDGVSMHNWRGNTTDYVVENGNISLDPSNGGGGNLFTAKEYKNFVFRFEFQLTDAANNGLGIRTPMQGDAAYSGMELQILDNENDVYKDLQPYQYHGSVYGIIPAKRGFLKPVGEWNVQEVVANGDNIKVTLNGEVILDGNIREASSNGTKPRDGKDHPGLFNEKGYIGFLGHGSPVKFRNIRIKELK